MKVTLSWLKEFVDISLTPQQLADSLTMAGLEVESFEPIEYRFHGVVVGRILSCARHPQTMQLTLCEVDAGSQSVQVVCGADNVAKNLLVPLALPNAELADGSKVSVREIRGLASNGVLCSEAELGLSDRGDGLMVLTEQAKPGTDLRAFLGMGDYVFDVNVTPNRPDCLSVYGLAREIGAITGKRLRSKRMTRPRLRAEKKSNVKITIGCPDHCYRYSGRLLENVVIGPSPYWMASRLHAAGMRAINNVVDITNYVMLETGQPLHAFDYHRLAKHEIHVRTAHQQEKFITLDGQEHSLDEEMCLICDGEKAVALAGIMGGLNSEVLPETQTVFLESAYFEPTRIRRSAKKLALSTESSRRFERGANPNGTLHALNRASELLVEIAGASLAGATHDVVARKVSPLKLTVSLKNINTVLSVHLTKSKVCALLAPLEIAATKKEGDQVRLVIPTFRPDLTREIDIVEEVGRLYGYDHIPQAEVSHISHSQSMNERIAFSDKVRLLLSGLGLKETVSVSLVTPQIAGRFLAPECGLVELLNPLNAELSVFRPSLLISALSTVAYNRNRQIHTLRLFELGHVAWKEQDSFIEKKQGVVLLAGHRQEQTWYDRAVDFDFYDIKGVAHHLLSKLGVTDLELSPQSSPIWDQASVHVRVNGQGLGSMGRLSREICEEFKIKQDDLYAFLFDFDILSAAAAKQPFFEPIPRFPSAPFDVAILADVDTPVARIEQAIRESGGPYLRSVQLFDFYKGEQIPAGKKSLAFSLTFSSKERTLEKEVGQWIEAILTHLKVTLGAELRPR